MKVRTEVGWDGWIGEVVVWMVVVMGMLLRHLGDISMRRALSGDVLDEVGGIFASLVDGRWWEIAGGRAR